MKLSPFVCSLMALSASLFAQNHQVVPAAHQLSDANSQLALPGLGVDGRMQILVDGSSLQSLVGRSLSSLSFRRNHFAEATDKLGGELKIRLSPASQAVGSPSTSFALNSTGATTVFSGRVEALAHDGVLPSTASWGAGEVVEIDFATPYPYSGGDLVIDLFGTRDPNLSSFFPIDATSPEGLTAGSVTQVADACGAFGPSPATVGATSLVPGSSQRFVCVGEPGALANLMIGQALPQPFDLTLFGAPGCSLHVAPVLEIPSAVTQTFGMGSFGGIAQARTDLPATASLLGASFYGQWAMIGTSITLSNTLRIDLAGQASTAPVSIVQGEKNAATGRVRVGAGPVLRFGFQ